jgi:hypothetical protein
MKSTTPMKSRTLLALAVAGSFACAGAFAGGYHHGGMHGGSMSSEVQTPANVSESAPWLAAEPQHLSGWHSDSLKTARGFQEGQFSDGPSVDMGTGASSSTGGSGAGGFHSLMSSPESMNVPFNDAVSDARTIDGGDSVGYVEYWLLGADSDSVGTSSPASGSGTVGFDSMSGMDTSLMTDESGTTLASGAPFTFISTPSADRVADSIGEVTPLLSEHYLVYGPLAGVQPEDMILLEVGPTSDDAQLIQALSGDFYVLTPAYDEG